MKSQMYRSVKKCTHTKNELGTPGMIRKCYNVTLDLHGGVKIDAAVRAMKRSRILGLMDMSLTVLYLLSIRSRFKPLQQQFRAHTENFTVWIIIPDRYAASGLVLIFIVLWCSISAIVLMAILVNSRRLCSSAT